MCISTGNFDWIFFLGVMPLFEFRNLTNIIATSQNISSAQLHRNCSTEFLCSYEGHNLLICIFTGNANLIFFREQSISLLNFGQSYFVQLWWNWFSVWLPVTNAWNWHTLYSAFSGNVGAWGMYACSLFLSFL